MANDRLSVMKHIGLKVSLPPAVPRAIHNLTITEYFMDRRYVIYEQKKLPDVHDK